MFKQLKKISTWLGSTRDHRSNALFVMNVVVTIENIAQICVYIYINVHPSAQNRLCTYIYYNISIYIVLIPVFISLSIDLFISICPSSIYIYIYIVADRNLEQSRWFQKKKPQFRI